jgi:hypothetical protein
MLLLPSGRNVQAMSNIRRSIAIDVLPEGQRTHEKLSSSHAELQQNQVIAPLSHQPQGRALLPACPLAGTGNGRWAGKAELTGKL